VDGMKEECIDTFKTVIPECKGMNIAMYSFLRLEYTNGLRLGNSKTMGHISTGDCKSDR
jgi:hypothetical protein